MQFSELDTPALLIERQVLELNLSQMQDLADQFGVKLRPHIKTHKSTRLAQKQVRFGACGVAVAKLSEAEVMIGGGITDIQVANQVVGEKKIRHLRRLSESATLSCAIDNLENARELSQAFEATGRQLSVLVEIDSGLHRCGLSDRRRIQELFHRVGEIPGLRLIGIMTHAGHAYGAAGQDMVRTIGEQEAAEMVQIAEMLRSSGEKVDVVSVGSTPTAPHAVRIPGVTELRVGNYIFNDLIQVALGTVPRQRCALSVLATVISVGEDGRLVIDAGSKALTTETGAHGNTLVTGFGRLSNGSGTVIRLSEEHGVVDLPGRSVAVGSRIRIVPNHACAVVNLFNTAYVVDGDTVVETLDISARGCSQ